MIVPMKRLTLVALKADEEAILQALQRTGTVEVISQADVSDDKTGDEQLLSQVQRFESAAQLLKRYGEKPPMGPKPEMSAEELFASMPESVALMERTEELDKTLAAARSEIEKKETLIETLLPWERLDARIEDIHATRSVRYAVGFLPLCAVEQVEAAGFAVEAFPGARETAVLVASAASEYDAMQRALKELDFAEFNFPAMKGTPRMNIRALETEIASLRETEAQTVNALETVAKQRTLLLEGLDATSIERDRARSAAAVEKTASAFILEGWVRADEEEKAQKAVAGAAEVFSFETREPLEEEAPPSAMKNKKLVEPFESIVTMYAYPSYRGVDATAVMAPFYFLFFGMMLSDAGYGLVMTIACAVVILKYKNMEPGIGKMVKMFFWCGLSTTFWGFMFGSFFGDAVAVISSTFFHSDLALRPIWFEPVSEPIRLLTFSFLIGIIHLFVGLGLKFYQYAREGKYYDAVCDVVFWYLLVGGGIVYLLTMPMITEMLGIPFQLPPIAATVAAWCALAGLVGIILTGGRDSKNPFARLAQGLYSAYNVTGYLSDILSYSRLMVMMLAGSVIGQVFNILGAMPGGGLPPAVGIPIFFVIFIVGHAFNIGLNVIGTYVHTSRLQYLEFFKQFYKEGGRPWRPLNIATKFVDIKEEQ